MTPVNLACFGTLPLVAVLAAGGTGDATPPARGSDEMLVQLLDLQRRVRGGELVALEELALGRVTREEILTGVDISAAVELGLEPAAVRARLAPGFVAELEALTAQRTALDAGPPREPSPLLTMVLDLEQELKSAADRRRQRLGIKSPLASGPLSQRVQPMAEAGPAPLDPAVDAAATAEAKLPELKLANARLRGATLYKLGRHAEALAAWQGLAAPQGDAGLEFDHQRADCLMRTGRSGEAITIWERIATDHATTPFGEQASFSLKVAHTIAALENARKKHGQGGGP